MSLLQVRVYSYSYDPFMQIIVVQHQSLINYIEVEPFIRAWLE